MGCPYCYFSQPHQTEGSGRASGRARGGRGRGGRGGGGQGRGSGRGSGRKRGRPSKQSMQVDPRDSDFQAQRATETALPQRVRATARAAASAASAGWQPQLDDDGRQEEEDEEAADWDFVSPRFARGGRLVPKKRRVLDEDELDDEEDQDEEDDSDSQTSEQNGDLEEGDDDVGGQHAAAHNLPDPDSDDGGGAAEAGPADGADEPELCENALLAQHDEAIGAHVRRYLESWSAPQVPAAAVAAADALFRQTIPNFHLPDLSTERRTWQKREVSLKQRFLFLVDAP